MTSDNRTKKVRAVLRTAGRAGKVRSMKKIHKLIYLLQTTSEDFGYRFYFHNYGVYSAMLARDIEQWKLNGDLVVDEDALGIMTISLSNPEGVSAGESLNAPSIELCKWLGKKKPVELEALSTIVYLRNRSFDSQKRRAEFELLKPHLKAMLDDMEEAADELYSRASGLTP